MRCGKRRRPRPSAPGRPPPWLCQPQGRPRPAPRAFARVPAAALPATYLTVSAQVQVSEGAFTGRNYVCNVQRAWDVRAVLWPWEVPDPPGWREWRRSAGRGEGGGLRRGCQAERTRAAPGRREALHVWDPAAGDVCVTLCAGAGAAPSGPRGPLLHAWCYFQKCPRPERLPPGGARGPWECGRSPLRAPRQARARGPVPAVRSDDPVSRQRGRGAGARRGTERGIVRAPRPPGTWHPGPATAAFWGGRASPLLSRAAWEAAGDCVGRGEAGQYGRGRHSPSQE